MSILRYFVELVDHWPSKMPIIVIKPANKVTAQNVKETLRFFLCLVFWVMFFLFLCNLVRDCLSVFFSWSGFAFSRGILMFLQRLPSDAVQPDEVIQSMNQSIFDSLPEHAFSFNKLYACQAMFLSCIFPPYRQVSPPPPPPQTSP